MASQIERARQVFRDRGGTLRTGEALVAGIHPRTLYEMREAGGLEQLARGLYRLADLPPLSEPDLATVAKRIPQGVICLISALAFHELTTQIPHEVHLALPRTARYPKLKFPPLHVFHFSREAYLAGIETHAIDAVPVRVYVEPVAFSERFAHDPLKAAQWRAFVRRTLLADAPTAFPDVARPVRDFLQPVAAAIIADRPWARNWRAGGPW